MAVTTMMEENVVYEEFIFNGIPYYKKRTIDTDCSSAKSVLTTADLPNMLTAASIGDEFYLDDLGCNDSEANTNNDPTADLDFSGETDVKYYQPKP